MTSPGGVASAAEPLQPSRYQWLSDQDAHFHSHARRFQTSPLGYFKWTSKADNPPHEPGMYTYAAPPLFFPSPSAASLGALDPLHHGLNDFHRNTNSVGSVPGAGAGTGGTTHPGGGLNYVRATSTGSLSSPPTPTNGPNTPLVIPHPVKPPASRPGNKTYQCKICDQVFTTKSDMLIHCQQIHKQDPKPYKCSTCSKSFANSSCLSQHTRIHSGLKPYKCEICERKFTQLSHLQQHIRTHTGEKPYKCMHPGCGKAFSQLSSLQSHSRSHMTDKPFRCNSCYKCYADEQSLREHIPKHSDTKHLKTHICHICGKSYTQETYLTRHMAKHTQENVPKMMPRPIKREPMDLVDRSEFISARLPERSTPSDLSMPPSVNACSKGSAPSSAFMPLSPFAANTVSSSSGPGYHYSPGLSHNSLSSPLPHISSMASPRYFPYDPIGFGRKAGDAPDRNLNMTGVQRESMIANSLLSLQHIKNYASQQMPSFTPTPTPGSRLAWPSLDID